jgi:hypothetical protein
LIKIDHNIFESEIIFCKNLAIKLSFKKSVVDFILEKSGVLSKNEIKETTLKDYLY